MKKQFIMILRSLCAMSACIAGQAAHSQNNVNYHASWLEYSKGWGAVVADMNRDGHDDVYNTGHDVDDRIWYWTPTGYVPGPQVLPYVDRHACASADMNRDGTIDMYCAVGAVKGTGAANNELWLQSAKGVFTKLADMGAEDSYGRSRRPVFFDMNHDGYPDLYSTVEATVRTDGQPNINRTFINQAGAGFVEQTNIATGDLGYFCAVKGDIDGDGWDDLAVCSDKARVGHLFLNNRQGNFIDLQGPATAVPWVDAKLVDVNGDGRDDLVVVNTKKNFQIWLNSGVAPFFPAPSFQYKMDYEGQSVAIGDFDGDGRKDVYVVLYDPACKTSHVDPAPDLVFWGQAGGSYSPQVQPQPNLPGCGHLAATVDGDKVLLEEGDEGDSGGTYVLSWK